ncbi:hypothetical protein Rctr85_098 [Virus Rctr85]|nr:hypothetical protein Rctr85_098 [Virus Rctr85]
MPFTPTSWPNTYLEQVDFIRDFLAGLSEAEQSNLTPTLVLSTTPSVAQINAAWQNRFPSSPLLPVNGRLQWFNPALSVVENVFTVVDGSSGEILELSAKARDSAIQLLGIHQNTVVGAANLTVDNIDQSYQDLLVWMRLRLTAAAANQNSLIRFNDIATATYAMGQVTHTTTVAGAESTNGTSYIINTPAATAHFTAFAHVLMHIKGYSQASRNAYGWYQHVTSVAGAATGAWTSFVWNNLQAITKITVTPQTASTIDKDTVLAVFGMK